MNDDHIADPLVRLAFEAKRKVENLQQGVHLAERDLLVAQTGLELARDAQDSAHEDMRALMAALTATQQSDLILLELAHHQNTTQAAQKALGQAGVVFGSLATSALRSAAGSYLYGRSGDERPSAPQRDSALRLLPEDHAANGLQVVWRQP